MFLHVLEAQHVRDYVVRLKFSDGADGEVNLASELDGPVFGALRALSSSSDFRSLATRSHGQTVQISHPNFFANA